MAKIREIFAANKGRYGFRRIVAELRNQGVVANHKKARRLMAKTGLAAISRKRKHESYLGEVGHVAKDVIARDFKADGPNKKWTTDVSQFACPFGKCYLSPIIDMGSGDVDVYVTGSNSRFLSSDIRTEFRGQSDEIRTHP